MKEAKLHAEVWHSHGPNDPATVEGYYAGTRWIRITLHETQCLVQRVVNWRAGAANFKNAHKTQNPPLEQPGKLINYEDWREIDALIHGAENSCIRGHPDYTY